MVFLYWWQIIPGTFPFFLHWWPGSSRLQTHTICSLNIPNNSLYNASYYMCRKIISHWQPLFSKKMAAAASFSYKVGGLIFIQNWRWRQGFGKIIGGCSDMVWILVPVDKKQNGDRGIGRANIFRVELRIASATRCDQGKHFLRLFASALSASTYSSPLQVRPLWKGKPDAEMPPSGLRPLGNMEDTYKVLVDRQVDTLFPVAIKPRCLTSLSLEPISE